MSVIFTQLILFCSISQATIYYVNPSVNNPSNNGETWNNAFNSLSQALTNANRAGDEIWLLGGHIYYPSTTTRLGCFASSRGIKIYGGFTGTETSISQRGDTTSIISGDIGTIGDTSDNCYHVVTYDRELTLDNVIISNGNANWNDINSPLNTLHTYGGALITSDSTKYTNLNLYNVTFKDNQAINGGALWFEGSPKNAIDVTIENCKFVNNIAINGLYQGGYAGAIYLYHLAKVTVTNTIFMNNNAQFRGGAVYIDYGAVFNCDNCLFDGNSVDGFGGAVFAEDRNSQTSGTFPVIQNSIFRNNKAAIKGDCILYFNGVIGTMINNIFDDLNVIVLINSELTAQSDVNQMYVHSENEMVFTGLDDGLVFDIDVELIELGNNLVNIETDLIPWVDGSNVCYVSDTGNNIDGLSWNSAYNQLQSCIDIIGINGGEIWVKSGTYYPTMVPLWKQRVGKINNMHKSFVLYDNVRIYGGFYGTENKREDRDWVNNPTYLSCDLGKVQCNEIMMAADGALIDGFIFKDAGLGVLKRRRNLLANSIDVGMILSSTSGNSGSGIYSNSTTITVVNSIFLQLFTSGKGAAVYCIGQQGLDSTNIKSPTLINVAFLGNRANMRGGSISADAFCHFKCKYCKFDGNSCANKGGAIYLDFDSQPTIENSKFNNNWAGESGGCVALDGRSFITFNGNMEFIQNGAMWEGGCLYSGSGVGGNIKQGFSFEQAPVFTGNYMINNGIGQVDIYGWAFTEVTFSHIPDIQTSTKSPEIVVTNLNEEKQANFIIFVIDDILWSSSWMDSAPNGVELNGKTINYIDVDTPNIQRIIDEGITFSRVYANPKCAPSRFTLLTGRYAVRSEWARERTLKTSSGAQGTNITIQTSKLLYNDGIYNVPNMLKTIGNYYTAVVGKWHLMSSDDNGYNYNCESLTDKSDAAIYELCTSVVKEEGFDFVDGFYYSNIPDDNGYYSHNPEWMVERSQTFIDDSIENKQPFFLYFSSTLTHTPGAYDAMFNYGIDQTPKGTLLGDDIPYNTGMSLRSDIWDKVLEYDARTDSKKNSLAAYLWLDEILGALIKHLQDKQLYDDTFIVLTSDHGMGAKGSLYEQGSRIMQFVRYPKLFGTNGHIMDDNLVVGNVDLAATIFDIAGISDAIPDQYIMDSKSWLQNVIDSVQNGQTTDSIDNYRFVDIYNSHAIVSTDYVYIFRAASTMEIDNDVSSLYKYSKDKEQLYSLKDDQNQQNNIIKDENMKDIVYKFRTKMIDYIITTACYVDNKDECIVPELTYIPQDSEWNKATPSPTEPTDSALFTCNEVINWEYTWRRVQSWNEDQDQTTFLSEALSVFLGKRQYSDCGEISILQYLYDFEYSLPSRLDVYMIFCCGINAQFGDNYDIPIGYKESKYINAEYVDVDYSIENTGNGDTITQQQWFITQEALFLGIGVALCLCCVCGIVIWKHRNKNKDKQMVRIGDDEMNINVDETLTGSELKINTKLQIINCDTNDSTPSDNKNESMQITPFEIETEKDCITLTYCVDVDDNGEM